MSNWDLSAVLAERPMPTAAVTVYLNEYASHAKTQLLKAHSKASGDAVAEIDAKLEQVEEELQKSRYEIHLEAIPADMREDIHARALKEYPPKTNFLGQPSDDDPAVDRIKFENDLLWAACIRKLITPTGQEFTEPSKEDVASLTKGLTATACIQVDKSIRELHEAAEKFTAEAKNPDF